ncbi:glycosyl-transferase for dystroglycan-domain-containing protein [Haematococcus lacustris]
MVCRHMPGYLPLLLLIGLACSSAAVLEEAQQLLSCYNRNATAESLYFRDFVNGRASKMTLHTILWSTKLVSDMTPSNNTSKPAASLHPLTIVTTANKQRLGTLEAQCNSWPGPLTAAIWVPLENDSGGLNSSKNAAVLNETLMAAQSLFDRTEVSPTSCALRLLLMTELLGERAAKWLYPINSLRNAAILASDTPMVAMVDVDLLLSNTLAKEMMPLGRGSGRERATSRAAELARACRAGQIFVMPAFEPCSFRKYSLEAGRQVAEQSVRVGKQGLVELVRGRRMCYFQENNYRQGHNSTLFPTWYQSSWPYKVSYTPLYEPWYIVDRFLNPWYDARYRSYGWNKQQQVAASALGRNLTLLVHPTAFVVHRPHERSHMANMWCSAINSRRNPRIAAFAQSLMTNMSAPTALADKLQYRDIGQLVHKLGEELFLASVQSMREGRPYEYQVDPPLLTCLRELPWWQAEAHGHSKWPGRQRVAALQDS